LQGRSLIRDVNYIGAYMRIYPPALRLRASDSPEDYFRNAASLRGLANKALSDAAADDLIRDSEN
jgi:hypothetical protein